MIYHRILQNDIVFLRAIEPTDIEFIYNWENDTDEWINGSTQTPYSRDLIMRYIESSHQDIYTVKQLRLMIDVKEVKKTVGTIDFYDFDPNNRRAGVGILIDKNFRNKGYASAALERMIDYGFQVLNLNQIFAQVAETNVASMKLFEKFGFQNCGIKKDWIRTPDGWINEHTYQLINSIL